MTEVRSGLAEGEEVVVSGQFLIDSESQLQEAIQKMLGRRAGRADSSIGSHQQTLFSCPMHPEVLSPEAGRCPKCGMDLEEREGSPEELKQLYGEHVGRQERGDGMSDATSTDHYTCPMHSEIASLEPGRCPICGMFLEKVAEASEEEP